MSISANGTSRENALADKRKYLRYAQIAMYISAPAFAVGVILCARGNIASDAPGLMVIGLVIALCWLAAFFFYYSGVRPAVKVLNSNKSLTD